MKPEPPDWLLPEAAAIFTQVVEWLNGQAIESDTSIIADYACAQHDVNYWSDILKFEGPTITGKSGNPYANPTMVALMTRRKDLERLRRDLGFTPKQRGVRPTSSPGSALHAAMNS